MSTYKGDSPGKKLSRFRAWSLILQAANRLQVPYQGAYVLAGEGGDLSVLRGWGLPMDTVTAVDFDQDWLDYCNEAYPGVQTACGEAGELSERFNYSFAHLDFCGGLTAANIRTVADVAWNVGSLPSIIAVTMLKGREHMGAPRRVLTGGIPRARRRRHAIHNRKMGNPVGAYVLSAERLDPRRLLEITEQQFRSNLQFEKYIGLQTDGDYNGSKIYRRNGRLAPFGKAMLRAMALQGAAQALSSALYGRHPGDGPWFTCIGVVGYHSRCSVSGGTPFFTAIFAITQPHESEKIQKELLQNNTNFLFHSLDIEHSLGRLAPTAVEFAKMLPIEQVADLFDVPVKTVIAWKAHATRGTYTLPPLMRLGLEPANLWKSNSYSLSQRGNE